MTIQFAEELLQHKDHQLEVAEYPDGSACVECTYCAEILVEMRPKQHGMYWVEDCCGTYYVVEADGYEDAENRVLQCRHLSTVAVWEFEGTDPEEYECEICQSSLAEHVGKDHYFFQ